MNKDFHQKKIIFNKIHLKGCPSFFIADYLKHLKILDPANTVKCCFMVSPKKISEHQNLCFLFLSPRGQIPRFSVFAPPHGREIPRKILGPKSDLDLVLIANFYVKLQSKIT